GHELALGIPFASKSVAGLLFSGQEAALMQVLENSARLLHRNIDARGEVVGRPRLGGVLPDEQQRLEMRYRVDVLEDEGEDLVFLIAVFHLVVFWLEKKRIVVQGASSARALKHKTPSNAPVRKNVPYGAQFFSRPAKRTLYGLLLGGLLLFSM